MLSNDINDREKAKFIESSSEPGQTGVVVLNPDGSNIGGGGGGSGTEYTEGATDASITGSAIMWEDTSDTLRAVSAAKPLPVNIVSGSSSGTQYTEGDADASITGTAILWENTSDTLSAVNETTPLPTRMYVSGGLLVGTNPDDDTAAVSGISLRSIGFNYAYNGTDWVRVRGDVTNGLDVDITRLPTGTNAIGRVGHDITGIGHGVKTITSAGTDEALATSTACKRVVIQAQTDNTTGVAVGGTGVDATVATGNGVFLYPGDSIELEIDNLADVYIDALTNGEGVRYTYFT